MLKKCNGVSFHFQFISELRTTSIMETVMNSERTRRPSGGWDDEYLRYRAAPLVSQGLKNGGHFRAAPTASGAAISNIYVSNVPVKVHKSACKQAGLPFSENDSSGIMTYCRVRPGWKSPAGSALAASVMRRGAHQALPQAQLLLRAPGAASAP